MDNLFDSSIIKYVNQYSQSSHVFDLVVYHFFWNNMLKGGVIVAMFWWLWFQNGKSDFSIRARLTSTLVLSVLAVAVTWFGIDVPVSKPPISYTISRLQTHVRHVKGYT